MPHAERRPKAEHRTGEHPAKRTLVKRIAVIQSAVLGAELPGQALRLLDSDPGPAARRAPPARAIRRGLYLWRPLAAGKR